MDCIDMKSNIRNSNKMTKKTHTEEKEQTENLLRLFVRFRIGDDFTFRGAYFALSFHSLRLLSLCMRPYYIFFIVGLPFCCVFLWFECGIAAAVKRSLLSVMLLLSPNWMLRYFLIHTTTFHKFWHYVLSLSVYACALCVCALFSICISSARVPAIHHPVLYAMCCYICEISFIFVCLLKQTFFFLLALLLLFFIWLGV